jgi:thymidine kinase
MPLDLITGPMFSGKSEELIRRLRHAQSEGWKTIAFKFHGDIRYSHDHIASHSGLRFPCHPITCAGEILGFFPETTHAPRVPFGAPPNGLASREGEARDETLSNLAASPRLCDKQTVVGIDEAHFFEDTLVGAIHVLVARGIHVLVAGLNLDYLGRPFGPMPELLALANRIVRKTAICARCGDAAAFSQRLVESSDQILIGAAEMYEPRCRSCFAPHPSPSRTRDFSSLGMNERSLPEAKDRESRVTGQARVIGIKGEMSTASLFS